MEKYLIRVIIFLFVIILQSGCCSTDKKDSEEIVNNNSLKIKIASFNMCIFGNTKLSRINTFTVLAEIATNFDIIALQEVGSNNSTSSDATCISLMDAYISKVNELVGSNQYSYVRGNQYAIVYKIDRFTVNNYVLYTGTQTFTYTPLIANFTTTGTDNNFDFSLITIHTSPSLATTEIPALITVMNEVKTIYSEPDVICLGDYNADGSYYTEGTNDWLAGFDPSVYITGITNSYDTTVASSSNTYDRIQMTNSLSSDYAGAAGVFKFGDVYDVSVCEGTTTTVGTEEAVSDHYPVWCEYYVDKDID